uniref:Peptidoglycan recognition protein 5 n=1 Tax=Oncorhynchus kisutch TaxID=8019 RepID=A0A8C7J5T8_ONCKI
MDVRVTVEVVTRGQWGAAAPQCRETLKYPAQRVIIHHTALHCGGIQECMDQLIHIQRMHMQDRNFDDIGYNFLIGGDCTVYEGRGWGVVGTHTKGNNHNSLAIAFMGNFNSKKHNIGLSISRSLQCVRHWYQWVMLLLWGFPGTFSPCIYPTWAQRLEGHRMSWGLYAALKHLKFP